MYETPDDLTTLQKQLDSSYANGGAHLKSIFTEDRLLSASDLCRLLTGVQVLNLATVTKKCEPRVAPVDGLFYRAVWWFGTANNATRIQHLKARPQVSATHARGEEMVVIVHGNAELVDVSEQQFAGFRNYCIETYGDDWVNWIDGSVYARIHADRVYGWNGPDPALVAEMEAKRNQGG